MAADIAGARARPRSRGVEARIYMLDVPRRRHVHIHPAMRDRVLRVSSDPRLKLLALSGVGATSLESAIRRLENLTATDSPSLTDSDRRVAEVTTRMLRLACGRLTAWENGKLPSLAEASAVATGLTQCHRLLTDWRRIVESDGNV
jgi:hypothetical protein